MAQDYTNMSVQDKLKLADERLEKLKGTDKYDAFKERVDAMHAKYGSVPETYTWAVQKLHNRVEAYEFDAKAHGRVDKNGEADFQKDPLPMLDEWVVLGHGGDKYGISERGLMTRPIPEFFTRPTKPPSPDELADSYRKATKPLDYLSLKRGGTVDELAASFKVMKRGLGTTQAAKGGEAPDLTGMSNFLATDKVPDTIFGIPIVSRREDYTKADIAFFKEHPEAGGYYDMGDAEGEPPEGPEPTPSEEPIGPSGTSGDLKGGKYDTVVPKGREAEYRAWKAKYAPNDSGEDYDLQGAFMEGLAPDPRTGHWPDKYKKPNHPTFSVESKYAVGADANLAGTWDGETYVPNPNAVRELWNRAVKSTGNLDGMARVFAAMSGESSLNQRGATAEQISNGHLARLIVHANETDRYNGNPANRGRRTTLLGTVNRTSHVLSPKYAWGTGPGANWFDTSKMEPRFDLINANPIASRTARDLILNTARFLNGDLRRRDWLPSDATSYGDGPKGLMPDREEIKPEENRIGPMPRGFRIGRKKGAK